LRATIARTWERHAGRCCDAHQTLVARQIDGCCSQGVSSKSLIPFAKSTRDTQLEKTPDFGGAIALSAGGEWPETKQTRNDGRSGEVIHDGPAGSINFRDLLADRSRKCGLIFYNVAAGARDLHSGLRHGRETCFRTVGMMGALLEDGWPAIPRRTNFHAT
jgi:hypothetical protein